MYARRVSLYTPPWGCLVEIKEGFLAHVCVRFAVLCGAYNCVTRFEHWTLQWIRVFDVSKHLKVIAVHEKLTWLLLNFSQRISPAPRLFGTFRNKKNVYSEGLAPRPTSQAGEPLLAD